MQPPPTLRPSLARLVRNIHDAPQLLARHGLGPREVVCLALHEGGVDVLEQHQGWRRHLGQ
jgi:hypothetical protein